MGGGSGLVGYEAVGVRGGEGGGWEAAFGEMRWGGLGGFHCGWISLGGGVRLSKARLSFHDGSIQILGHKSVLLFQRRQ